MCTFTSYIEYVPYNEVCAMFIFNIMMISTKHIFIVSNTIRGIVGILALPQDSIFLQGILT